MIARRRQQQAGTDQRGEARPDPATTRASSWATAAGLFTRAGQRPPPVGRPARLGWHPPEPWAARVSMRRAVRGL